MLPRSATLFSQVFQGYAAPSPAWATGACLSSDRWRAEQALQAIWKKSVEWYGMTLETFWVLLSYDERGKTVIPAMTLTASFHGQARRAPEVFGLLVRLVEAMQARS